ncbi:hypothetical protein Ddye_006846 [Dipteronia dyeriana]|uniref:Reverse transcriptase domain-containing protein n=1 Tax=Dipteronia dyeriana TaxID=168575 RepID=A0AAE0CRK0_9ROSI|nr:hypothetical protein Ddye_006846 [Dipteronia dyeriana]
MGSFMECDGDKVPGPDDLNVNFVKSNWEIIKVDFMNFKSDIFTDGSVVRHVNKTFVALIPKVRNPLSLKDYMPIRLVGVIYKKLAKGLANRLKKVLNSVVSPNQMAFVKDRQIMDSFVIAEEIIHF